MVHKHRTTGPQVRGEANWPNQRTWGAGGCSLPLAEAAALRWFGCLDLGTDCPQRRTNQGGALCVTGAGQFLNWWRIHMAPMRCSGGSVRHPLWARPCRSGVARSSCRSQRQCRARPSLSSPQVATRLASRVCLRLARGQATPNTHPPSAGGGRGANGWGRAATDHLRGRA